MHKLSIDFLWLYLLIVLLYLHGCDFGEMEEYYTDKENYVTATGTVTHIAYDEGYDTLYLAFSDMSYRFDGRNFKIEGDNFDIVMENGIEEKLAMGKEVEFITAPRYFGDGYVMPIVSITIDGETLLEFEEGYENFLETL